MASDGDPYPKGHSRDCLCSACHEIYTAHCVSKIGVFRGCVCNGCSRRAKIGGRNDWQARSQRVVFKARELLDTTREARRTMATINMCERQDCGSMFKSSAAGLAQIQSNATYGSQGAEIGFHFDGELCPGCVGDIVALLNSTPTTPRKDAYDKPWSEAEATKSESPFSGLSDVELAAELIKRQGLGVAKEIAERPQDTPLWTGEPDALSDPTPPRNVTKPDETVWE